MMLASSLCITDYSTRSEANRQRPISMQAHASARIPVVGHTMSRRNLGTSCGRTVDNS